MCVMSTLDITCLCKNTKYIHCNLPNHTHCALVIVVLSTSITLNFCLHLIIPSLHLYSLSDDLEKEFMTLTENYSYTVPLVIRDALLPSSSVKYNGIEP